MKEQPNFNIGSFTIVFIVLVILKFAGVLNISWLWVFAPLWLPLCFTIIFIIVVVIIRTILDSLEH